MLSERDSNIVALNGPAARKAEVDDQLFILSYAQIDPQHESLQPIVLDLRG
jgi:aspartate 1-decarboxylase